MAKSCCENKTSELTILREKQAYVLKIVMVINFVMFIGEFSAGIWAHSTALMGDSLDMLGDAIVYAFSLYVLHRSEKTRATAALLKGFIIIIFGLWVCFAALSKSFSDAAPITETMGIVGFIALVANTVCLILLTRHKDDDINMKSTWICSRNDIISNVGVLFAAVLVTLTHSKWPDIITGFIIATLFLKSAWPILTESILEIKKHSNPGI